MLSAKELKLTEIQRNGLVKVLRMLETGELIHVPNIYDRWYDENPEKNKPDLPPQYFNMGNIFTVTEMNCDTACCIAGASDMWGGTNFIDETGSLRNDLKYGLLDLFCPEAVDQSEWRDITIPQAVLAIRNYLTTGDAKWKEILEIEDEIEDEHPPHCRCESCRFWGA